MRNYNEEFMQWLEQVREIDPKSHEDLPEELQKEFEKLMLLASIPFCHIYGEDPEAMSGQNDWLRTTQWKLIPSP